MANGTTSPQSGGILDTIGSGVKGLAGIAGQVLPYALPIGLGAVMGHGLPGGALGGGAAGLAMAEGASGERQRQEKELVMREQELGIRAQEADIDLQKAQMSLQSEKETRAYAKTITDPTERAMYLDPNSRTAFFENKQWKGIVDSIANHPNFQAMHPELTPTMLNAVGPKYGAKLLEAANSGKFINGIHGVVNADGTYTYYGLGAIGPDGQPTKTAILTGVVPKTVTGAPSPQKPPDIKALVGSFRMMHPAPPLPSAGLKGKIESVFAGDPEKYASELEDYLTSNGVEEDKAKAAAKAAVGLGASAKADPNAKLKGTTKGKSDIPPPPAGFSVVP